MTPHLNRLAETIQMRGHNLLFYAEITKIIPNYHQYSLLSTALDHLKLTFILVYESGQNCRVWKFDDIPDRISVHSS